MASSIFWPLGLPGQRAVVDDVTSDTRIRTPTDTGAGKVRARYSAAIRKLSFPLVLNGTELGMFDYFWDVTLEGGALAFRFEDPKSDALVDARFLSRPTWSMQRGGSPTERVWRGQVELEVLAGAT